MHYNRRELFKQDRNSIYGINLKKIKSKRIILILISWFLIPVVLAILLLYKPTGSQPAEMVENQEEVSSYLTHILLPEFYNGAQRQEPFELVIRQEGINEAITQGKWPKKAENITFLTPRVFFEPEQIRLIGTVVMKSVEFVLTIAGKFVIDEEGLLNLNVDTIKVGAINVTPVARMVAEKMYAEKLEESGVNANDLGTKVAGSLFSNIGFEPVFKVGEAKIRAEKITVSNKKLVINFIPADRND